MRLFAPACSRSPPRWSAIWRPAGCGPTHTTRVHPTRRSCDRCSSMASSGPQLDRGPDSGESADPRLGARRQPARSGACTPARRSPIPSGSSSLARSCCADARALCSLAPSAHRLPGGLVVEHGGEHRGRLDLKHGGVIPIVDLARWAAMAAGVTSASTIERLRAAGTAGTLPAADAQTLEDAFELIAALRMQHQVRRLRAGEPPDDYVGSRGAERAHAQPPEGGVPGSGIGSEARRRGAEGGPTVRGDWRDWRPAIWLTMLGVGGRAARESLVSSALPFGAAIGAAVRILGSGAVRSDNASMTAILADIATRLTGCWTQPAATERRWRCSGGRRGAIARLRRPAVVVVSITTSTSPFPRVAAGPAADLLDSLGYDPAKEFNALQGRDRLLLSRSRAQPPGRRVHRLVPDVSRDSVRRPAHPGQQTVPLAELVLTNCPRSSS